MPPIKLIPHAIVILLFSCHPSRSGGSASRPCRCLSLVCHPERRHSQPHRECRSRRTCGCFCRCLFSISQPKPLGCPILCSASPQRVGINTLNSRTLAFALARASTSPTPNSPTNCHPERRHSQPHRECRSRRTCGCLCRCSCLCLPPHKSRHLNRPSPSKSPRPNESQKVQSAPGAAT
jgi:hypothetical protein